MRVISLFWSASYHFTVIFAVSIFWAVCGVYFTNIVQDKSALICPIFAHVSDTVISGTSDAVTLVTLTGKVAFKVTVSVLSVPISVSFIITVSGAIINSGAARSVSSETVLLLLLPINKNNIIETTMKAAINSNHCVCFGVFFLNSKNCCFSLLIFLNPRLKTFYCIRTTLQLLPLNFSNLSHNVCAASMLDNGPIRRRYKRALVASEPKSPTPCSSTAKNTSFL